MRASCVLCHLSRPVLRSCRGSAKTSIRMRSSGSSPPRKPNSRRRARTIPTARSVKTDGTRPERQPGKANGRSLATSSSRADGKRTEKVVYAPVVSLQEYPADAGGRAGSAQRAAVRADHQRDPQIRHPLPGQAEGRRSRRATSSR